MSLSVRRKSQKITRKQSQKLNKKFSQKNVKEGTNLEKD
jgi:hypothetical protein